jgi:hypothetical protein
MLHEVLTRMQHKSERRLLPEQLPEWKFVNKQADIWALRHCDKKSTAFDPSSLAFVGKKDKSSYLDETIQGIAFEYRKAEGRAKITYLSTDSKAQELRKLAWTESADQLPAYTMTLSPTDFEIALAVNEAAPAKCWTLVLWVWYLLGHMSATQ